MYFCLTTIIKNEHKFLDEWIQYHINLGINKIFIFEDINSKSHKDICDKYDNVELNSVKIFYEDDIQYISQITTFKKILKFVDYQYIYDWCFYLDIDEFITFENNDDSLEKIFTLYNDYDFVQLQWMNYNANNHIYSLDNVIESYTEKCWFLQESIKNHSRNKLAIHIKNYKNIMNNVFNHHHAKYNYCKTNFDRNKDTLCYKKIYIRHYITKSFEDWIYKIYIRGQFYNSKKFNDFFILNPNMNKNELLKLVPKILKKYKQ